MVLAIHQQLLNLAAGEGRRLLYADTAPNPQLAR